MLPVDVMNANHRIYPRGTVEAAIARLSGRTLPGYLGYLQEVEHPPAFTVSNVELRGDAVVGDVHVIDPRVAVMLEAGQVVVRTAGTGKISDSGEVTDYELTSFAIVPTDQDAFRK